ncbi:hypothetical protein IFM89_014499, partial [Coptis chinensis]
MMKVITLVLLVSLLIEAAICVEGDDQNWSTTQHEEDLDVNLGLGKEKVTRLHFYFHDIERGNKPSAVTIAEANSTKNSPYAFGELFMADDALTVGPELTSKIVGRAQGLYGSADQQDIGLVMALTLHFTEGKYNGSDLSILGRNGSLHSPREFPIVGGTGLFRYARGVAVANTYSVNTTTRVARLRLYVGGTGLFRFARGVAVVNTYSFNSTTGDAVVEYNVTAIHYYQLIIIAFGEDRKLISGCEASGSKEAARGEKVESRYSWGKGGLMSGCEASGSKEAARGEK